MKKGLFVILAIMMLLFFVSCEDSPVVVTPEKIELTDTQSKEVQSFGVAFAKIHNAIPNTNGGQASYVGAEKIIETINSSDVQDLYIKVANGIADGTKLTILGKEFSKDDQISISIGLNVFYKDAAFKIEEGKLSINKIMLFLSMIESSNIVSNDFIIGFEENNANTILVKSVSAKGKKLELKEGNIVDVSLNDSTTLVTYDYENSETSDLVFVVTKGTNGIYASASIMNKTVDDFGSYLVPYGKTYDEIKDYNGKSVEKDFIVVASDNRLKGKFNLTFNIKLEEF